VLFYTLAYIVCSNVVCIWDVGWLHGGLFFSPEGGVNTCITGYFETESRVNSNNNNNNNNVDRTPTADNPDRCIISA